MFFIKKLITNHKNKVIARKAKCDSLISQIDGALKSLDALFEDENTYIDHSIIGEWFSQYSHLHNSKFTDDADLRKAKNYKTFVDRQNDLRRFSNSLGSLISEHNDKVAEAKLRDAYSLIGDVEGRKLDRQQMMCVIKEAHNHLVIAGAGTGKTTTIVGKIKYLLKSGKYKPEDILVLSFTNASASEMKQRIVKETDCDIAASTFHKLGLNIITVVNGKVPKITTLNLPKFVKEQLNRLINDHGYLELLSKYLYYNHVVSKSEFDFSSQKEYDEYLKLNPPATFKKETVKSYGEMDIANFLAFNGINYVYEQPYKIDTNNAEYGQYKPDFYLPDYDIYIEYFGINRNGEVPAYFSGSHGKTASQAYRDSMAWKRETHTANETVMIECFAYEKFDGALLQNLEKNLIAHSVSLNPQSAEELWENISSNDNSLLDGIIELFQTVINLIKSNDYTIDDVRKINSGYYAQSNNMILSLIEPIYNSYCQYLNEHDEIDFNDMINSATALVRSRKYVNPYKCVIVDEYQDISKSRFLLLKSLRESSDYDLFCVGDDWQSIYRFAGSDIGYIVNFDKYWGATEESKIETTYRFPQQLIDISSSFVMQNPSQMPKNMRGNTVTRGCAIGEINGYTEKYAIEFTVQKLDELPENSTVYFIGRYTFDVKLLEENGSLECKYNNVSRELEVKYAKRPDLKMSFVTAHRSKGLQADYVFIINNKDSRMGFPSRIQDDPILDLLLENSDRYPYAEERRLFYVALTRAKKKAIIVTVKGHESEFAKELIGRYGEVLKRERFECPLCGGRLVKHSGPYGEFYGCSNYRTTGCRFKRKIYRKEQIT